MFGKNKEITQPTQTIQIQQRLSCGHPQSEAIELDNMKECGVCIEALNLGQGLKVELVQTETKRQVLLFVHKDQTMIDPETNQILARAPLKFGVHFRIHEHIYCKPACEKLGCHVDAFIGSENLIELFYGRATWCNLSQERIHGQFFADVQKFLGGGFATYFQKANRFTVKLAEVVDPDHIRITPYMAHSLKEKGFYAMRVTYPPQVVNGQEKSWYESLQQEDNESRIACEPEIEVLLAP